MPRESIDHEIAVLTRQIQAARSQPGSKGRAAKDQIPAIQAKIDALQAQKGQSIVVSAAPPVSSSSSPPLAARVIQEIPIEAQQEPHEQRQASPKIAIGLLLAGALILVYAVMRSE